MIIGGRAGDIEVRAGVWDGPKNLRNEVVLAGAGVTGVAWPGWYAGALRLATVACAIRLVSETPACFRMRIYEGDDLNRVPVSGDSTERLLTDPADGLSAFDMFSDVYASIETHRAGFLWKIRDKQKRIAELWPLDPDYVRVTRDGGVGRRIEARIDGKTQDVTGDVLMIRAWAPRPDVYGFDTLQSHERSLQWAAEYEQYRGRYFQTGGAVRNYVQNAPKNDAQRRAMATGLAGALTGKSSSLPMLWDGAELKSLGVSMVDAQAAELSVAIAQDVARMFRIYPPGPLYAMVQGDKLPTAQLESEVFYKFALMHRVNRVESALYADRELFPNRNRRALADTSEFVRGDLSSMTTIVHQLVQDGTLNRDEARALLMIGLGPIPGGIGQEYLKTPVGAGAGALGDGESTIAPVDPVDDSLADPELVD